MGKGEQLLNGKSNKTFLMYQCSAGCGSGLTHRRVTCIGECDESSKPHSQEDCHTQAPCQGEWLSGRWTVCSHSCGNGIQTRTVVCSTGPSKGRSIVSEKYCAGIRKPKANRNCYLQACSGIWFTEEWGEVRDVCLCRM